MTRYTHLLDEVPVGTVVRAADGTIAARYDHQRGVIFGDDRPFPWEVLQAPAVVLWPRDECIDVDHLERQAEWSARTFGPGRRTKGLIDHITKELAEIEADPDDISEWADLLILAFDGAWRHGHSAADIIRAIKDKQAANEARTWPDWRGRSEDEAIEHERKCCLAPHERGCVMPGLSFDVKGVPGAQGSKRHVGRGIMVESSKKVAPWRTDVRDAAIAAMGDDWRPLTGAVTIDVTFHFPRPKSHYGTGRNTNTLKPSAPAIPTSRAHGDIDKLVRSTLDALVSAGVMHDDSLVVDLAARKQWGDVAGCILTVSGEVS